MAKKEEKKEEKKEVKPVDLRNDPVAYMRKKRSDRAAKMKKDQEKK